jgi:D-amino peptidase
MKVFISADMEGISGIASLSEVNTEEGKDYSQARKAMTADVNAAIDGAIDAGAKEIWVRDAHGGMTNILPEELDKAAILVRGSPALLSMIEGLDDTFDCMLAVGYHSMSGTPCGLLDHTYSGRCVSSIRLNGKEIGEFAMNAMVAGHFGVPVVFISGDGATVENARSFVPNIVGVEVKRAVGRYAASCIHPSVARGRIHRGAEEAVNLAKKKAIKPFKVKSPVEVEVEFRHAGMADVAQKMPSSERRGARTVACVMKDPIEAYKAIICLVTLASTEK